MSLNARDTMTKYVITAHTDMTVREARNIMSEAEIRHLPIVQNDKILGILSDRDLLKNSDFNSKGEHFTVSDIMTANPICCSAKTPLLKIAQIMVQKKIDSVPIVDQNNLLIGLVTSTDILELFTRGNFMSHEEQAPWEYSIESSYSSFLESRAGV